MAATLGTKIVDNGLVLYLDAANIKSYSSNSPTEWIDITKGNLSLDTGAEGTFTEHSESTGFLLNGIDEYFEQYLGSAASYDTSTIITGDVTTEVWFKISALPASGYVRLFGKGGGIRPYGLWYRNVGFLHQRIGNVNMSCEYASAPQLNQWYHMVGTSLGTSDHRLYLNGVEVQTSATSVSVPAITTNTRYRIGVYVSANFHNGYVANVKLYDRALSAKEVLQNFNAHRDRFGI